MMDVKELLVRLSQETLRSTLEDLEQVQKDFPKKKDEKPLDLDAPKLWFSD